MFNNDDLSSLRWSERESWAEVIDQTLLPHALVWAPLETLADYCHAIASMQVRGAPLIGITAAFGLARAMAEDPSDENLRQAQATLLATRPTAVNLGWSLQQVADAVAALPPAQRGAAALETARALRAADVASCEQIGEQGLPLLRARANGGRLNVMTHCNAGWLAAVKWGTALAPVYKAHAAGLDVHVWVSETRPRNQGMNLTGWELQRAGVPFTVVVDSSCGPLLRDGQVDCVIVGSDRTAANGDVCNKVGTYLKALAARAAGVPFYVALPASTVDWRCATGDDIPIEERGASEVLSIAGLDNASNLRHVSLAAAETTAYNPSFDITPAELVTGLVTEHGVFSASCEGLVSLKSLTDSP